MRSFRRCGTIVFATFGRLFFFIAMTANELEQSRVCGINELAFDLQ